MTPNGPEVEAFVRHAREFCSFVDNATQHALMDRLRAARVNLLALYAAGSALPQMEPPLEQKADRAAERPARWPGFGVLDSYWEVFDPYQEAKASSASLSDDLLDVYADVKHGLSLWDTVAKDAAVAHWRFRFETHWGAHAVDALRALHHACHKR